MREEFMHCGECRRVTRWALLDGGDGIYGECEDCGNEEVFDDWNEVVERSVSD